MKRKIQLNPWKPTGLEVGSTSTGRSLLSAFHDLWEALLQRLENPELGGALNVVEAARVMKVENHPNCNGVVSVVANHVRKEVRKASKKLVPNPSVYVSRKAFALCVRRDAPPAWGKIVGPSIGLLLADAADWFVGLLVLGVSEVCNAHGYELVVDVCYEDSDIEASKLRHMLQRTNGALIVPVGETAQRDFRQLLQKYPCVLIDRYIPVLPDVPSVHSDDISAGRQAALYLQECGCSRVLVVDQGSRSPTRFDISPLQDRWVGCKKQLKDSGIKLERLLIAGSDEEGGFQALEQFEKKGSLGMGDGIFAFTDRLALGCHRYLNVRKPPLGLPIIGIEGQPFGDFITPPFASIHVDMVEMGRRAAKVLFAKLEKAEAPATNCPPHFLINPTLLKPTGTGKRDSVAINFPDAESYYSLANTNS